MRMGKKKKIVEKISPSIVRKLAELESLRKAQLDIAKNIMTAYGGAAYALDLYILGAINRSMYLSVSFAEMIKQGNAMCAIPILRLQMDSVMRVSAFWVVSEPHQFVGQILKGKKLNEFKSKDDKKLTDQYLHTRLSEEYKNFSKVYDHTSGFIHLSEKHMFAQVESMDETERTIQISIGPPKHSDWAEKDVVEVANGFIEVSKILNKYCEGWFKTKNNPPNSDSEANS